MKCFLAIILIIGIASVTAGLLMMDHGGNCFMSSVIGGNCFERLNIFEFFGVHLNFLKSFSNSLLAGAISLFLLSVFLLFLGGHNYNKLKPADFLIEKLFNLADAFFKIKFFRWFSLLENSPALI